MYETLGLLSSAEGRDREREKEGRPFEAGSRVITLQQGLHPGSKAKPRPEKEMCVGGAVLPGFRKMLVMNTDRRGRRKGLRDRVNLSLRSLPQGGAQPSAAMMKCLPGTVACRMDSSKARVLKGSRLILAKTGTQRRPRMKQA